MVRTTVRAVRAAGRAVRKAVPEAHSPAPALLPKVNSIGVNPRVARGPPLVAGGGQALEHVCDFVKSQDQVHAAGPYGMTGHDSRPAGLFALGDDHPARLVDRADSVGPVLSPP